ncbi:MAG: sigma-70 family RNA polymerase sigma factor [Candidatus Eisenbacteria bacterium]|nr:sigma-70 family RNA polymerase sigma factor [Candidatus Eisenbacteria bacterium]
MTPTGPQPETPPADDAALVARARQGDRAAFDGLVRRHAPRIFGLALRLVRDRDEAEDVVQEACVKAWLGLSAFHGGVEFRAWLLRIALNAARDHLRARRRRPDVPLDLAPEPELRETARALPDEELERRMFSERVARAVDRLGPEHREILLLRAVEELSYDEMAAALEIPRGTVMSRLARARERLRALLDEGVS